MMELNTNAVRPSATDRGSAWGRAVAGFVACLSVASVAPPAIAQSSESDAIPVAVARVSYESSTQITEAFAGVIAPRRESRLGFETGGLVAAVHVDVGDTVTAGDVLAELDVRRLSAEAEAAASSLAEAQAAASLAEATVTRQRTLLADGHVSQQALDEAIANADVATARVDAAAAREDQVRVQLELAELVAPYDAVVTERFFDEGTVAAPGAPVLDLAERGALELQIGLPRRHAAALAPDTAYRVTLGERVATARLRASTGIVDRATQTVAVRFDVSGDVDPGEIARLHVPTTVDQSGVWAPVTALAQGRRGLWTVFVLDDDGQGPGMRLARRPVNILYTREDAVFITGDLTEGDLYVSSGLDRVVPGQRVRPAGPADQSSASPFAQASAP